MTTAIRFESISKQYRLGQIGTGTLAHDLHRIWARFRGQPDPFTKVGEVNDRTVRSDSSKSGDYVWALRDLSLEVEQGEILGIIGRNGAGKSTLLKLLARVTAPTSGQILTRGRIANLLEVGTGFHPELTGRENIFLNGSILGMSRREIEKELDNIVQFSGCSRYIDTPVKRYSSGMAVRLGFSVAAHLACDILVVDEVLAVGDFDFQQRCIGRMREVSKNGRTVLFVSHNIGAINQLCDRCAVLEHGQLDYAGDVGTAVQRYLKNNAASSIDLAHDPANDFQFTKIQFFDLKQQPSTNFGFEEPFKLQVGYRLAHRIDGLEIGVRVINSNGMIVFTTQRSQALHEAVSPDSDLFEIKIPGSFLTPGQYFIDLGAHIPNQRILDMRKLVASFRIDETGSEFAQYAGTDFGAVICRCQWSESIDQANPKSTH